MDQKILDFVSEKTQELIQAPSCSKEAKEAAQSWLAAVGTEKEAEETKKYIEELEADIMPIENLIGFAKSDAGIQYFGEEKAKNIAAHAEEIQAAGEKYCDCPACAACAAILSKKDALLNS